ncbi:MAG: Proposed peptidoglycan lipid II flippase MurJ [uncultured Acidimicrobiales bacterium]|uniref:Probable lipid II flippase MurJ n=1 Tax=uncultured Acidimicrobiales bacterium TaxID=310071 RepID=A0A6J4H3X0_9ACTN|nr:MAG: Proposed peptidoglycan lipid II flippase MurJ [uncultured Acidimicrobiales bacterium]
MAHADEGPDVDEGLPANLGRSAAVMAVGTTLSRITGLGRLVAMAIALGVTESRLADSYNVANTMPNVIYELILGGLLTSVFIPVLVEELRKKRDDDAWESVSALVTTSLVTVVAITVLVVIGAPWIIRLFTFRLSGEVRAEQQELATFFLRIFAPQIAFYGIASIAGGLLNAHDRFAVPMFAPILNNVVVIATLLAFAAFVPLRLDEPASLAQKLLLGVGTTAGVAILALAHWPAVRRLPGKLRWRPDFRHPSVRKLARLSLWTLGYVVANQLSFSVGLVLAYDVEGGVTAMFIAFAFFNLPYGIAAVSIMTALVPRMSSQAVEGDEDGFRGSVGSAMRLMGLLLLPATAGYLVLSRPLVTTLLEHGVMEAESSELVAEVLNMFAIGLVPFSFYLLLLRAFYARQDAKTPTLVNVVLNTVYAVFSFILFPVFRVQGLAFAHSLCYFSGALLAGILLSRRIGGLGTRRTLAALSRAAIASFVAAVAMVVALQGVNALMDPSGERALVQLVAGVLAGGVAFLVAAKALRIEELDTLRNLLPGRSPASSGLG